MSLTPCPSEGEGRELPRPGQDAGSQGPCVPLGWVYWKLRVESLQGGRLKNGFFGGGKDNRTARSALAEVEARTGGCPSLSRGEAQCASTQSLGRQWTLLPHRSRPQVASPALSGELCDL